MHTILYLVCAVFYGELKSLDYSLSLKHHYSERFWATIYGVGVFLILIAKPSLLTLFAFGRSVSPSSESDVSLALTNTGLSYGEAFFVALLLGMAFYYFVRLGQHFIGGRYAMIIFVPGLSINSFLLFVLVNLM